MYNTIASIALLLISAGVSFVYIVPQYGTIMDLRSKDAALSQALDQAKDIDSISRDLSEKMRSISKDNIDRLARLLPPQFDELRFVNDLQGVGERSGLAVKDLLITDDQMTENQPAAPVIQSDGKGYITHKFSFSVSAPYNTFVSFLQDLERSLEFIDITSIRLSASPGSAAGKQPVSSSYDYQIEFVTYSLK